MAARGLDHERLSEAVSIAERQDALRTIIRETEAHQGGGRGAVTHDGEQNDRRRERDWTAPDRSQDLFPGR
jgi:hypothetical protein